MDKEEVQDRLRSVINNLIRNEPDQAQSDLHDVLASKMRDRVAGTTPIGPTEPAPPSRDTDDAPTEDDEQHEDDEVTETEDE